jgi:uncharacterized protein with FMN-binding domain
MHNRRSKQSFNPERVIKKFFLSAFVVFSFIAYALHRPYTNTDVGFSVVSPTPSLKVPQQALNSTAPPLVNPTGVPQQILNSASGDPATATSVPQPAFTPTPDIPLAPPAVSSGLYKDGTYTGPEVDVFYGLIQVKTVIKNGKMAGVQFTEYPNDRRTSVRINSIAMPYLQQEALQAQNANVDIITGATLTSQGFIMSLQSALDKARG